MSTIQSRQDRAFHVLELAESLVEGYELEIGHPCEGSEVGVIPDLRGKGSALRQSSPLGFDPVRFLTEKDSGIAKKIVVDFPGSREGHYLFPDHLAISGQPQKPLLCESAKGSSVRDDLLEPVLRDGVMRVSLETQGQPDVYIGKEHDRPLVRDSLRFPALPKGLGINAHVLFLQDFRNAIVV